MFITSDIYTHLSWDDKTETMLAMEKAVKMPAFDGIKSALDNVETEKSLKNSQKTGKAQKKTSSEIFRCLKSFM